MKLTKISALNFKGASFTQPLAPLTLFVGANFAGKSARTDAIRLLLLGYLPELGATNAATFALSSGASMRVEGEFDNGIVAWREWKLKGNSVTSTESIPDEIKNAGALAVMLNSDVYFSLSDQKRVEYVFGLVDMAGVWTAKGIAERLADKVDGGAKLIASIETASVAAIPVQQYVAQMIEGCANAAKLAAADVKRKEAMIVTLTAARSTDVIAGPSLITLESMRTAKNAEIARLNEAKGGKMADFTAMINARHRREAIDRELRFADKNLAELGTLREKQKLAQEALESAPVYDRTHLTAANTQGTEAKNSAANHRKDAGTYARNRMDAEKAIDALDAQTTCPYCGASGDGWKAMKAAELVTLVEELKGHEADSIKLADSFESQIPAIRAQYTALVEAIDRRENFIGALKDVTEKIQNLELLTARLTTLKEERERLPAEDAALDASVQTIQTEINVNAGELREIESGIKAHQGREHEKQRLAVAESERDAARIEADTAKEVGKELKTIQSEMVAAAFGPLLAYANSFFSDVLKSPLAYHDGEIGRWDGAIWVGHKTFSGTEKSLCYAAIQAALASQSPVKLMIIDELGRLTEENVWRVISAARSAIHRGLIDEFIGIEATTVGTYSNSDCLVVEVK